MDPYFRKFEFEKELSDQRKLFLECFPETHGTSKETIDHYLWKFHEKNVEPKSSEFGAYINNSLSGYYAAIPFKYQIDEVDYTAGMVCDVMTGISARGKGVFTKLGLYSTSELANEGYDFSSGFPIRPEVIPGHTKAGWTKLFELPLYGCFINTTSFFKQKNLKFLGLPANLILSVYSKLLRIFHPVLSNTYKIKRYSSNELIDIKGLDDFYNKWKKETRITLDKDVDFLKWRLGAPESNYQLFVLYHKEEIKGVIITREILKEGLPCLGILEIASLKGYYQRTNGILRQVRLYAHKKKLDLILIMLGKYWFKKYRLSLNAFFKTPYNFTFIIKKFNPALDDEVLFEEKNWHLTWLDSDDL